MQHVKTFLFLACCFVMGMGIMEGILWYRARPAEPPESHTGVGNAPPLHGFYFPTDAAAGSLPLLAKLPVTAIALTYSPASAASGALKGAVEQAHRRGLKVILLPPPIFSPTDPYPEPLADVAAQAAAAKVDFLCLSWLNSAGDGHYWITEAAQVRRYFKGPLILAATPPALVGVEFTECCDYIAAIGPIAIPRRLPHAPDDVDLHALRMAWDTSLSELVSVGIKAGKPLILLQMEIPVTTRAKLPLPGRKRGLTPDPKLQALSYEALLLETKGRDSVEGIFLPLPPDSAPNSAVLPKIATLWSESTSGATSSTTSESPATQADTGDDAGDPFQ